MGTQKYPAPSKVKLTTLGPRENPPGLPRTRITRGATDQNQARPGAGDDGRSSRVTETTVTSGVHVVINLRGGNAEGEGPGLIQR